MNQVCCDIQQSMHRNLLHSLLPADCLYVNAPNIASCLVLAKAIHTIVALQLLQVKGTLKRLLILLVFNVCCHTL